MPESPETVQVIASNSAPGGVVLPQGKIGAAWAASSMVEQLTLNQPVQSSSLWRLTSILSVKTPLRQCRSGLRVRAERDAQGGPALTRIDGDRAD